MVDRTSAFKAGGLGSIPRMRRIFILNWTFSQRKCGQVGLYIKLETFSSYLNIIFFVEQAVRNSSLLRTVTSKGNEKKVACDRTEKKGREVNQKSRQSC